MKRHCDQCDAVKPVANKWLILNVDFEKPSALRGYENIIRGEFCSPNCVMEFLKKI